MNSILESIMMICFGASWPMAIIKTLRVKNPAGKSILFLCLIEIGYLAGLTSKLLYTPRDPVIWLYLLNFAMVGTDLSLTLYYGHRNRLAASACQTQPYFSSSLPDKSRE